MDRIACLSDLNNYFKKQELLSGLTKLEQDQLRKNIGVTDYTGEGGQTVPTEITYAALLTLITRSQLVTGARYIITDFRTIYSSNVINSSGKKISWGSSINPSNILRLVVTALTTNQLDPRVVIENSTWLVEYDVTQKTLEDGVTTLGEITYLEDDKGNSAFYDFKNKKFRRNDGDYYTFSDIINGIITDSSTLFNTRFNRIRKGCDNNVFLGDTYYNIIEEDCQGNTFKKGCHDTVLGWSSVNNVFNENVCYMKGSLYNKTFLIGDTSLSTSISKTIHKVNEATIISFLDPITYSYQIIII